MACNDGSSNPITPVYSDAKYVLNPNCVDADMPSIYIPEGGGGGIAAHELIAGDDILIEDFSDATTLKHRISYDPFIALTAQLAITGYVGGLLQSEPILKGKTVDEIRSAWSYNKGVISSQEINSVPVTPITERSLIETGLSVTDDITYTLDADDGAGYAGSIAQDTDSLLFGNYQIWGDYTNMLGQAVAQVPTLITNLANKSTEIKRSRGNSVFATGSTGRYFFVIYPKAWGEGIFYKEPFYGGFQRLKNDAGTLVVTLAGPELPISWTNEEGYSEEVYIYQSLYDDTEDAVTPIIIS